MLSSKPIKFFFALVFVLFLSASCRWQQAERETASPPPQNFAGGESKPEIPFSTKEPQNFQAEFVVTVGSRETKTFFARDGDRQRCDYRFGAKNQFTVLQTGANQNYLIFPARKIYAEKSALEFPSQTTENPNDLLNGEWLNARADAGFTKLGTENNLTKYLVSLDGEAAAETIVFVDEAVGLPVRQEFYSIDGERKILTFTYELRNFKTKTENDLFEIPEGFRRVSPADVRAAMKKEIFDEE